MARCPGRRRSWLPHSDPALDAVARWAARIAILPSCAGFRRCLGSVYAAMFKCRVANALMPIMIAVQEQRPCGKSFDKSPEMVQCGRRRPPEPFGERDSSSSYTIQNTTAVSYPWATIPDAKRPEEHCG